MAAAARALARRPASARETAVSHPDDGKTDTAAREAMKKRLDEAETWLRRLRGTIEAGVEPTALVEAINEAEGQRAAARAELDAIARTPDMLSDAEVSVVIRFTSVT